MQVKVSFRIPFTYLHSEHQTPFIHTALHPRLKTPMRIVDLAYFVAEHDDHHLSRIRELVG